MTHDQQQTFNTTFIHLGSGVPAVLYEPTTPGPNSRVGVFLMHASGDYLEFSAAPELAKRGYRVLAANNSTSKTMLFDDGILDGVLLQIRAGVEVLRGHPGIDRVALFGHSGGATIMTAYQMLAEGGVAAGRGHNKIHQSPDSLEGLPAVDAVVLADSNWGQSTMTLLSLDPSVTGAHSGMVLDPDLDMFNPKNGFVPSGSTYSSAFKTAFFTGVAERNSHILAQATERLRLIEAGEGLYADDEPFFVPGSSFLGNNNKLYSQDVSLLAHSVGEWPLIHADGSSTTQVIRSVRPPMNTESFTSSMRFGALKTTVRNYLSSYAIRVGPDFGYGEDSVIHGVDWKSSYSNPPGNVEGITVPILALGMTGGWEGLAAETIYEHAASSDKELAFIEGATHIFTPCTECETTPGQFGDTIKLTYDYVDGWLARDGRLF